MSEATRRLRAVDWPAWVRTEPLLSELADASTTGGVELALVGGAVRDLLLGRPSRDFDFILAGDAAEAWLATWAAGRGARPLAFDRRGVRERRVALPGRDLDFVLVPPGGIENDLQRRDFTLNALAVRLPSGVLLDPTGGQADLAAGRLRRAGPGAFADDPLRALRAARLLAEGIATQVEDETLAALRGAAAGLSLTSGERVRGELDQMAATGAWAASLRRLHDWGCLAVIAPECAALAGVTQNAWHHLDVWEHTLGTLTALDRPELLSAQLETGADGGAAPPEGEDLLVLRYAALFHDLGKPATWSRDEGDGAIHFHGHERVSAQLGARIGRRWRFSTRRQHRIAALVRAHLRLGQLGDEPTSAALRRLVHDLGPDLELSVLLTLADTDATRGREFAARQESVRRAGTRLLELVARLGAQLTDPVPLLGGREVMALTGLPPGPALGALLRALLRLQVEGSVTKRAEAEAAALRLAARSGGEGSRDPIDD